MCTDATDDASGQIKCALTHACTEFLGRPRQTRCFVERRPSECLLTALGSIPGCASGLTYVTGVMVTVTITDPFHNYSIKAFYKMAV